VYFRRFFAFAFAIFRPFGAENPPAVRPGFQVSISVDDVRQRHLHAWFT
jgi:hypothetical protein